MDPGKRKPLKPQIRDCWKKKHQSLVFDENNLIYCKLYMKWETKIASYENFSLSFINSSSSYRLSNIESHFQSMTHLTAVEKKKEEELAKLEGITNRKKLMVQSDPLIRKNIGNMISYW